MSVQILYDQTYEYCCFYDTETMTPLGLIMYSLEEAEDFLEWLKESYGRACLRKIPLKELESKYYEFKKEMEKQDEETQD